MAEIFPFKGVLYNPEMCKDLRLVVTPPYDIISPEEQEKFYNRDEHNMIRLDLGKDYPGDNDSNNRYTRAAEYLSKWMSEGILIMDDVPSLYFYELIYKVPPGTEKVMKGFIALCKLEEFGSGKVVPHEYTLSKPKSDRLNLLRACNANLSLVFSLYSSPRRIINDSIEMSIGNIPPRIDIVDDSGIRHRLWAVTDPEVIELVQREMKDRTVYIADGHHRYEASLNYKKEHPNTNIMMYFANMDEPGLTILPTHRLLHNLPQDKIENILPRLERSFLIRYLPFSPSEEAIAKEQLTEAMRAARSREHLFGMYLHGDNRYILLSLKDEGLLLNRPSTKPMAWRRLDTAIFQDLILEDILGLSEESLVRQENLAYVKDTDEALQKVRSGEFQIAFLLNPSKIEEIKAVTDAGERMPQKSTYFYPKFLTGLVIYKF